MSNTSTDTPKIKIKKGDTCALQEASQFKAPTGPITCGSVMSELFERAYKTMTPEEFKWYSVATEQAGAMTRALADVINGIAGLVGSDEGAGNFQHKDDVARLLWFISGSLSDINALQEIGARCDWKLMHPNIGGGV